MPTRRSVTTPRAGVEPDGDTLAFVDATAVTMTDLPAAEYAPGVCNIGPAEIAARRKAGHLGTGAALGLLAALLATGAPRPWRLLVALPAAGAASGYLQARHRFCAAYGSRGVFSFGALGEVSDVVDPEARALDKATAHRIGRTSGLVGLVAAGLALAVPRWRADAS